MCQNARVSITRRLFAVSPTPALQTALTSPEAILAAMQRANSTSIGANVRAHWFDPQAATAWLEHARSDRFARATIDALPPAEQNARVVELYVAFGNYWRCLNISPYGWARWRRLCEALWGYPSYRLGSKGWNGKLNTPHRNGQYGGAWRQRAHAAIYAPATTPDQRGRFSPAFGGSRGQFYTGAGNPEFGPTDVVFGTPAPYAIENAGKRPGQKSQLPDTEFAPTVEVHRIWMQRTGALIGSYPDGFNGAYAARPDVGMAALWQRFNFSEPSAVPTRWDDWRSGFALPYAVGELDFVSAWDGQVDTQWTMVPLVWYWEMLRAVYPLVTGSGYEDSAGYSRFPEIRATVTTTVLDYLASVGPEAAIREVMFDVMQRNDAMATAHGLVESTLGDAAGLAELTRQRDAMQPSLVSQVMQGVVTVAGGVVSLVTANPAGLAMAGLASSAIKLLDAVPDRVSELRETDIFGRLMPVLDTVGIVDSELSASRIIGKVGLPSGASAPGPYSALGSFIGAAVLASGPLSIVDMPPFGHVEVGQDRAEPSCRWVDDTQRVWRCTIPTGPQWVRVVAPTGEARLARTEASNVAPATLTWGAMFTEHRYRIAGLPPGTEVFVDGSPAMGTWDSDAQAVWDVLMPQGPHNVRLIPPGGTPTLVQVVAQGAASEATWQALVTAGTQQRQQAAAATEGGGGWVLPVVVTLAAGGLLWATLTLGNGKRANPRGRRR